LAREDAAEQALVHSRRVLVESIEKAIACGLLPSGQVVLVACSGGADSVALAAVAARNGALRAAIGHVDHGLRPESALEAAQVQALAQSLGAPFFVERLEGLQTRGPGLEAAAREARYAALGRLARQAGASVVATAHTRRDQAETLLLRLLRGAGPGALAGVRRRRQLSGGIVLVRPLLDLPRSATEDYCRERGLSFTDDPHNSDPARARARLRRLWPQLLELNPRLEESLAGAADLFGDEDELMRQLAAGADLATAHPALQRRALLEQAAEAGVRPERVHLEQLRQLLAKGSGGLDLPGGRAVLADGHLRFEKKNNYFFSEGGGDRLPAEEVAVPGPGRYSWRSRELSVALGAGQGAVVDLERAPFPWTLRGRRAGDRFRPAGGHTKKVADQWIDARIPQLRRSGLALLEDAQGRIFWVEGLRQGEPLSGAKTAPASFEIR